MLKHLVLDMDETLIGTQILEKGELIDDSLTFEGKRAIARPFLEEFLYFAFDKFKTVSIWTQGTEEWFQYVYRVVLEPLLPEGKAFHFVKTREDCQKEWHPNGFPYTVKPLSTMFSKESSYTSETVLAVDDNVDVVYTGLTRDRVYRILPFDVERKEDDSELMGMVLTFQEMLK